MVEMEDLLPAAWARPFGRSVYLRRHRRTDAALGRHGKSYMIPGVSAYAAAAAEMKRELH